MLRLIDVASGNTSTLAGMARIPGMADGFRTSASFTSPQAVALDAAGTVALVADTGSHAIRRVNVSSGEVSTLAGSSVIGQADGYGSAAQFWSPTGVAMDATGSIALIVSIVEVGTPVNSVDQPLLPRCFV